MVDSAVAGVEEQLQQGVRVRIDGAGAHLHRQE
jgi:hypothetical protein